MSGTAALLWALGLVGIVFGLLNFFVGLFGAGFDPYWIGGNLVAGLLLVVAAAVSNLDALRERMKSGEARRAGRYGTSALLGTVLLVAILVMLAFLSTRYHQRFDWSEDQVHSLSDQSVKVLAELEGPVQALALFPPLDAGPVRELLDRYAYASPRFEVEIVDPNERPEVLAREGISAEELGQGLVQIRYGEDTVKLGEVTEEKVTNAMVKLARTGEKTVYFLQGHNEPAVEGEAAETPEGLGRAAEALRNENYRVESLLLAATGEVPEDADVVIVAGSTRPLLEPERRALAGYLARGGALLVMVDPQVGGDLVADLAAWGVEVGDDVIVDRALALFGRATSPFAAAYDPEHEITREMRDPALFHMVRSVRSGEGADFAEIVFTGESSWAERDLERFLAEGAAELDDSDLPGPVAVAVAGTPSLAAAAPAEGEAPADPARLVVFGDVDFVKNDLLEAYRNRDLFLNSVNWLMGDVEAISIRPRLSRASRFQLSREQFTQIRSLSLFVLPELIAIVGVFVWWSRRNPPE